MITASLEEAKKRVITDGWTIIPDDNKKPEISKKDTIKPNVIEENAELICIRKRLTKLS